MPLTDQEKAGCTSILAHLSDSDIFKLSRVVSNGSITAVRREEAVDLILLLTNKPSDLLKRQKLKKEVLYQYLVSQAHLFPPITAEKSSLIKMVLEFWGVIEQDFDLNEEYDDPATPPQAVKQKPVRYKTPPDRQNQQNTTRYQAVSVSGNRDNETVVLDDYDDQETSSTEQRSTNVTATTVQQAANVSTQEAQALAEQFVKWFYQMWNSLNPHVAQNSPNSEWGPAHFYDNADLKICFLHQERNESLTGNIQVCHRLQTLVNNQQLIFNHSACEGVVDSFKRVVVTVKGTVHQGSPCVGTFEHMFGLVRDPLTMNNWKIKSLQLLLRLQQSSDIQSIQGGSYAALKY